MPACLITGAARGIGRQIARSLISEGWNVVGLSRDAQAIAAAAAESPLGSFTPYVGDVRIEADVAAAVRIAEESYGGLAAVVANSGIAGPTGLLENTAVEAWREVVETNLTGTFLTCRAAIPALRRNGSGRIVLIGSTTGKNAVAHRSAYGATKAALIGVTRCLAAELGEIGITVNLVCPGTVAGARWDRVADAIAEAQDVSRDTVTQQYAQKAHLQRIVEPEEIAGMVAWLVSPLAAAITGQDINVCCGLISD
jgi:NAD(P)-dependent dehydrogenase (short-subunit alcohol dehydrogenase family)